MRYSVADFATRAASEWRAIELAKRTEFRQRNNYDARSANSNKHPNQEAVSTPRL